METKTIVRVWGNSLGIILPKEIVSRMRIKASEEVVVSIRKKQDIMKLFGSLKLKRPAQKMKDEGRKGWD